MLANLFEAKTVETAEIAQPAKCENYSFLYLLKSILKLQTIQNFKILSVNIKQFVKKFVFMKLVLSLITFELINNLTS